MKQFLSFIALLLILISCSSDPAFARGGHGGFRGGNVRGGFGHCIQRPTCGPVARPICGPRFTRPYYGYRNYPGYYGYWGTGWGYGWDNLPCYDGGSPYLCQPRPILKQHIYQYKGGAVMREYGPATAPDRAPPIINQYNSSDGAKPVTIEQ